MPEHFTETLTALYANQQNKKDSVSRESGLYIKCVHAGWHSGNDKLMKVSDTFAVSSDKQYKTECKDYILSMLPSIDRDDKAAVTCARQVAQEVMLCLAELQYRKPSVVELAGTKLHLGILDKDGNKVYEDKKSILTTARQRFRSSNRRDSEPVAFATGKLDDVLEAVLNKIAGRDIEDFTTTQQATLRDIMINLAVMYDVRVPNRINKASKG